MRTKSFVNTSLNVTETRIDKGAWKKIVTQSVHLEEHCTKIEILFHLFYAPIFLTNVVFKFNTVLIFIFFFLFFDNVSHNLLFCLLVNILYITVLKIIQCLYAFYKEQSNSDEAWSSIFEGFQLENALFLFFHEKCLLSNSKSYCWC